MIVARRFFLRYGLVMDRHQALRKAVSIAGGQASLARVIGSPVKQQHVYAWLNNRRGVPAEYAMAIEDATGVPALELRPDVFRAPQAEDAA